MYDSLAYSDKQLAMMSEEEKQSAEEFLAEYNAMIRQQRDSIIGVLEGLTVPFLKTIETSGAYFIIDDVVEKNHQTIYIQEQSEEEKQRVKDSLEDIESILSGFLF